MRNPLFLLAALVVGAELTFLFVIFTFLNSDRDASLEDLVCLNGNMTRKPYASRVLVPQITRAISSPLRATGAKKWIDQHAWNEPVLEVMLTHFYAKPTYYDNDDKPYTLDYTTEAIVCWSVLYAFFVGFLLSLRHLIFLVHGDDSLAVGTLASPFALLPFWPSAFVWDPATLFFWTALPCLLLMREWRLYVLVFILSCLNRETTVLFAVVFAAGFFGKLSARSFAGLLALQIVGAVAIKLAIDAALAAKGIPGANGDWHLEKHLGTYGLIGVDWAIALAILALCAVVSLWHKEFIGYAVVGPMLFAAYLLFGMPGEIRAMYEFFPLAFALIVDISGKALLAAANGWREAVGSYSPMTTPIVGSNASATRVRETDPANTRRPSYSHREPGTCRP